MTWAYFANNSILIYYNELWLIKLFVRWSVQINLHNLLFTCANRIIIVKYIMIQAEKHIIMRNFSGLGSKSCKNCIIFKLTLLVTHRNTLYPLSLYLRYVINERPLINHVWIQIFKLNGYFTKGPFTVYAMEVRERGFQRVLQCVTNQENVT